MSPGFTGTLSGQLIEPSQVSYNAIALSANLTLAWPNLSTTGSFTANIIEVTPSAGSLSITMPDATQRSVGQQVLFRNMTGTAFTVVLNDFTYHPEDLVFLSWFARQTPSTAVNGWYTFLNTYTSAPPVCH